MKIETNINKDDDLHVFTMHIRGDFDGTDGPAFREAYSSLETKPAYYIVDLKDATYIDSMALGFLLELRGHAKTHGATLKVVNMTDVVLEIMRVMNFHLLFKPEYNKDFYNDSDWAYRFAKQFKSH